MDINKAILIIKGHHIFGLNHPGGAEAFDMAVAAMEKQKPMKLIPDDRDIICCPNCGEESLFVMPGYGNYNYCANCGQRIDWSEND